ncbi:MAG: iron ABC transporter permease [Bacteroidia bacterium]|nr:iron ABC transporter permease [Bacteroidia bacterium]
MSRSKYITTTLCLLLLVLLLALADLALGSVSLWSPGTDDAIFSTILYDIRLPKTLTCLVAGSSLALCGLLLQSLFRNPLAGPYVLGVSSGASLFVAIATMLLTSVNISGVFFAGKAIVTLYSVAGAFFVTLIILAISKRTKSNVTILLVGMMLAQVLGAAQGLIEFLSSADSLKTFVMWSMGSVGSTTLSDLAVIGPLAALVILGAFFLVKPMNAILLNEAYAQNLGINVPRLRLQVILITSLLVGIVTAFCGPIAFVGISVPIASRLFFKTSHHLHQMTFCVLLGASVLLAADLLCQLISSQFTLPVNTVTTLIGSPVVVYLLFKSKLSIG